MLLGFVGFAGQIPVFLLAPIGGAVVFGLRLPVLRDEARQIIVALQMSSGTPAEEVTGEASVVAARD